VPAPNEEPQELPSPIPWLGRPGPVEALDRISALATASGASRRDLPIADPTQAPAPPLEEGPPNRRRLPIAPGQVVPPATPAVPRTPPAEPPKAPPVSAIQETTLPPRRRAQRALGQEEAPRIRDSRAPRHS